MKTRIRIIKKYDIKELETEANHLLEEGWALRGRLTVADRTFYLMLIKSV